jgi:threonine dehydratase/serine racemase
MDAAERIAAFSHVTPVVTCATLDRLAGRSLFFKCENLQRAGAFKFRGATNAVMKLSEEAARRGVVTQSSGNHGQALALAARLRGVDAHIVMPSNVSLVKRRAVQEYGGRVIECEPTLIAREKAAAATQAETGAALVHPYNDRDVIAGQGTAALELMRQAPGLQAIVTPVGGGGLLSGTCVAARGTDASLRIFGQLIPQTAPDTIADGLLTSLGDLTWPLVRDEVERVITVDDAETIAAMRLAWERAKLLIEPSAAVALATVLSDEFRALEGLERVGVVLSGGNVDLDALPW